MTNSVIVRHLGLCDYLPIWQRMKQFTDERQADTSDEIWLLQHNPVFTQGQAGKAEHIHDPKTIPVIQTDRGGQVTYHAPGQLIAYTLINVKRKQFTIRQLVTGIEQSVIALLKNYHIDAYARCEAPGVYIDRNKIASLGLRVRKGCAYHGVSLNVKMDLSPFAWIDPCGLKDVGVTQLSEYVSKVDMDDVVSLFTDLLLEKLG
jgi:lipoyl(octanoyl) transferase